MSSSSSIDIQPQQIVDAIEPPIVALAFEAGFYVLSLTSFSLSTYFLVHKGLKARAVLAMWITTLVMFAVSTCHLALQWQNCKITIPIQVAMLLPMELDSNLSNILRSLDRLSGLNLYLPIINYLLSDVIVFWRVWVMWERSAKAVIFPLLLALVSAVSGVISASEGIKFGTTTDFVKMHSSSEVMDTSLVVIYASVLATNVITTILIGIKSWQHRRLIKAHLQGVDHKDQVQSVLALLVESGIIYCIIWIVFIAVQTSDGDVLAGRDWYSVLSAIMVQISGIYPTAIIVLTALQSTAWDMSVGKEMSQNATRTEMRLALPNIRSVTSTGSYEPHASGAEVERGEV